LQRQFILQPPNNAGLLSLEKMVVSIARDTVQTTGTTGEFNMAILMTLGGEYQLHSHMQISIFGDEKIFLNSCLEFTLDVFIKHINIESF